MVKNQKGVTLIELLAAISLLSLFLLLANSIHLFGQKQMTNQTSEIQNQSNVRLAMNLITKQIRKASSVTVSNNVLTIDNTDVYKLDNNSLTKNNQPLITNLQTFDIKTNDAGIPLANGTIIPIGSQISLTIADVPTNNNPQTILSTTIYLRK
jgi:prepilin-type N-terminal cleavage/methylation domain-containing protein